MTTGTPPAAASGLVVNAIVIDGRAPRHAVPEGHRPRALRLGVRARFSPQAEHGLRERARAVNGRAVDRFAVELAEMRAVPGDQGRAAVADRRCQHRPVLLRQRKRLFQSSIGMLGAGLDQRFEQLAHRAVGLGCREQDIRVEEYPHPGAASAHALLASQRLVQIGLGFVELADALLGVQLHRQGDGGAQQQALGRGLGDQLIVGLEAERLAQLRGQRDDAAAGDGEGGFHGRSLAEMQKCRNVSRAAAPPAGGEAPPQALTMWLEASG